jgi:PadR family transcriptional regulator PadR
VGDGSLEILKGTLDVLLLKSLSGGALHGYAISRRIRTATDDALKVDEGALYPALRRLEKRGLVDAEWSVTDTGREARFYRLTEEGRAELASGLRTWRRYVDAMARVLGVPARG